GEDCLNTLVKQQSGAHAPRKFWHERNSLFFADYIETLQDPDGVEQPLNLTYAVRDGIISHCGEIDQQGIRPRTDAIDLYTIKRPGIIQPYTWEGCVVKVADKIAYLGRDLEDARTYHVLDMASYRELREIVGSTLGFGADGKGTHALKNGKAVNTTVLINDLIVNLCEESSLENGLCFSNDYFAFISELKKFNFAHIYTHWRLKAFQQYASLIIQTIFRTLMQVWPYVMHGRVASALKYYPQFGSTFEEWLVKYTNYRPQRDPERKQLSRYNTPQVFDITDTASYEKCALEYISGMTDQFAIRVYEEIITF
ncbi:MAG: metal-dependent phosphohydrolase, partial [Treponema sp.]|nr:metal-dependent phosphohydrolase [Treponema sp.]